MLISDPREKTMSHCGRLYAILRRSAILVSWEILQYETKVEAEFSTKLKHLLEQKMYDTFLCNRWTIVLYWKGLNTVGVGKLNSGWRFTNLILQILLASLENRFQLQTVSINFRWKVQLLTTLEQFCWSSGVLLSGLSRTHVYNLSTLALPSA